MKQTIRDQAIVLGVLMALGDSAHIDDVKFDAGEKGLSSADIRIAIDTLKAKKIIKEVVTSDSHGLSVNRLY